MMDGPYGNILNVVKSHKIKMEIPAVKKIEIITSSYSNLWNSGELEQSLKCDSMKYLKKDSSSNCRKKSTKDNVR